MRVEKEGAPMDRENSALFGMKFAATTGPRALDEQANMQPLLDTEPYSTSYTSSSVTLVRGPVRLNYYALQPYLGEGAYVQECIE
jgi:hypothetical protein